MERLILKKRSDFLCVKNKGAFEKFPHFLFQYALRECDDQPCLRFGFTVSKKVGNAVMRNRAKRRLREVVRLFCQTINFPLKLSLDCVLIARTSCATAPFHDLQKHFATAMKKAFDQHDMHTVHITKECS